MMRWTTAAALVLLGACSHPRSEPTARVAGGGQMMQCATAQAADLGYGVAPDASGPDRMRAEKLIPPEGGYAASVGTIDAWVNYGRDGSPRLKVRAQRVAQATQSPRTPRRLPGSGPGGVQIPGGGTVDEPTGSGGRRIPLGRVANDAGRVESNCRGS
jgi:hypothetical protein